MADQKACTLCGAEGHFAAQCSWNASFVQCDDGVHAINLCEGLSHYGWVMRKHPDGGYFSVRQATSSELAQAKLRATFDLHYQSLLSATSPAPEPEKQKPVAWAVFDGEWIDDHTADPNCAAQWAEEGRQVIALYAAPVAQAGQAKKWTYASEQETNCAGCGKRKHTPLRVDWMGGYVCLTCIDEKLEELYEALPDAQAGQVPEVITALAQAVEYLDVSTKEAINSGSVIHQRMRAALAAAPAQGM